MSAAGLYALATWLCLGAGLLGLGATIAAQPATAGRWRLLATAGAGLAALTVGAAWVWRWAQAGHLPIFGTYESGLSLAVFTVAVPWAVGAWRHDARVTAVACLVAGLLLAHAQRFDGGVYALTISERSLVVEAHAWAAWLAFGLLALNAAAALALLLPREGGAEVHAAVLERALHAGFVVHSAMLASGVVYRFLLFGSFFGFDPMETMGVVVWLVYGTLVHLRELGGLSAARLAPWCLAAFTLLVVSYRAIVLWPPSSSYHILDVGLRLHISG